METHDIKVELKKRIKEKYELADIFEDKFAFTDAGNYLHEALALEQFLKWVEDNEKEEW